MISPDAFLLLLLSRKAKRKLLVTFPKNYVPPLSPRAPLFLPKPNPKHTRGGGASSSKQPLPARAQPPRKNPDHSQQSNGCDIVKKASRKTRYLLVFNGLLAPTCAGRLGELAKLDTRNPVMYLDHEKGRVKLQGTMVFPKNKYMVSVVLRVFCSVSLYFSPIIILCIYNTPAFYYNITSPLCSPLLSRLSDDLLFPHPSQICQIWSILLQNFPWSSKMFFSLFSLCTKHTAAQARFSGD